MTAKVLFLAALSALAACAYDARYESCTIHCTADTGCPDDLTCGSEGLCRAAEAAACIVPADGLGGGITHVDGYTIHTYTLELSGSTFTPSANLSTVEVLLVAGGGGGGMTRGGGGGGGGGVLHLLSYEIAASPHVVTVGRGGAPATNGGDSSIDANVAVGGGAGRPTTTADGGSSGGASHDTNDGSAGMATVGQGSRGGTVGYNSGSMTFTGAGGGGAGGAGTNGSASKGGDGGPGLAFSISGTEVFYAGGGGGGDQDIGSHGLAPGTGGNGGGGNGGLNSIGVDGLDGTGGGGGGGGGSDPSTSVNWYTAGRGGSGVVIIRYPTER